MRDCANCFHRKPVLKEDGTWTAECEKWDCEFQSRENMIEKTKTMNNDLISREYIRKALNEAFGCENATKYGNENAEQQAKSYSTFMLYEIADIVEDVCDNAPTVPLPDFKEGYKQAIIDGKTNYSRPKGRMIIKPPSGWEYCSECGKVLEPQDKFCWNCGAKMEGNAK